MRRRRGRRGQSMVELAIVLPVLVTLFLGTWTAADLIGDNNTTEQAARAGARLGAELGDNGYSSGAGATGCMASSKDPCDVDQQIVNEMLPILTGKTPNANVKEIDIYQPLGSGNGCTFSSGSCPPNNGIYTGTTEPVDKYTVSNGVATVSGSPTYTLDKRVQTHPNEAELGVRVLFDYTSPTLKVFTLTNQYQYTVVRLVPSQ